MVKKYEILEHPADIGIKAYGNNYNEAFESAAEGLYSIMFENVTNSNEIIKDISIQAIDLETLVIKWLNEIIYYFDAEEFVGNSIKVKNIVQNNNFSSLIGEIRGEKFSQLKHSFKVGVKAVTFHQMEICNTDEGVTIQVFFDI